MGGRDRHDDGLIAELYGLRGLAAIAEKSNADLKAGIRAIAADIDRAAVPEPGSPAAAPGNVMIWASVFALVVGLIIAGGAFCLILWVIDLIL